MISIIAFIVVIFGSLNWLSIGFFQYDLVAGLFGYQGSIFSRIVYIVVGISAVYLIYVIIKNKGRLTVKKLKKEEQPIIDKMTKKDEETIKRDEEIAKSVITQNENETTNKQNQLNNQQTQNQNGGNQNNINGNQNNNNTSSSTNNENANNTTSSTNNQN
jgi:hypothetical protein